jgi:hypothetical protein
MITAQIIRDFLNVVGLLSDSCDLFLNHTSLGLAIREYPRTRFKRARKHGHNHSIGLRNDQSLAYAAC